MNKLREKIIKYAQTAYSSSPHEFSNEEIDFIIANKCRCDSCWTSIFKMDDFPEVLIEDGRLLCMDCYDDIYTEEEEEEEAIGNIHDNPELLTNKK